ncbi:hypothetical protein E5F05_02870 (plasmid) [Deinococcus metallilatus]|uniref:Uncharacterized protein n=1 Tax=Deinococcus metallilatus TaxID=1211322 RepID=A0AAJ5K6X8_9DEIO|nr:hypothetical protein E5F05_02870 [Deinococcus metallilatus]TLK32276.1 hypothetical protein FCS05_02205 [Deinococcus metallilatus]GMA14184.1 hypothetical protein GCM10025871_05150 [Deinococcus metallilatus]
MADTAGGRAPRARAPGRAVRHTLSLLALVLAVIAGSSLFRFKLGTLPTLALTTVLGLISVFINGLQTIPSLM